MEEAIVISLDEITGLTSVELVAEFVSIAVLVSWHLVQMVFVEVRKTVDMEEVISVLIVPLLV